ncbi:MAG: ABC transporter ATP-binding protein [Fretibacterium sp.]|nr:ABC transporter ATP-binding protein [Fretibacterium sp.]
MLEVSGLCVGYGKEDVLRDVSFAVSGGEFVCVLGANGCGKTTLLKAILGLLRPSRGRVILSGEEVHRMDAGRLARSVAYIPQAHIPPFPFRVRDVVMMGRTPYLGYLARPTPKDRRIVDGVLDALELGGMADRTYTKLSGGQRQMVLVARALAQQPRLLVMDEPTASLDFGNQYAVLDRVRRLSEDGMGVLMVTHDPDHAFFCADVTLTMKDGRILELGPPERVIREDSMQCIYRTPVRISEVDMGGGTASVCVPRRSPGSPGKKRLKREVPADPAAEHNERRRRDAS